MNILLTGASSFSGMWFVKELARLGHQVTTVYTRSYDEYTGLRKNRIDQLLEVSKPLFQAPFGSCRLIEAIKSGPQFDLFCHHAADVTNYKSPDFDALKAAQMNTHQIKSVLLGLKKKGCNRVVLTGSVFEQNEGVGSKPLYAVSPYGLSKGLTAEIFLFYTNLVEMKLGKFVIPNPFGAYEENRFTTYLANEWLSGKTPVVNTPGYIRDNIPITLLAHAYAEFALNLNSSPGFEKLAPSYFTESMSDFTRRFSNELRVRFQLPCDYELKSQTDFNEPISRINTEKISPVKWQWHEPTFWDQLASYYQTNNRLKL